MSQVPDFAQTTQRLRF